VIVGTDAHPLPTPLNAYLSKTTRFASHFEKLALNFLYSPLNSGGASENLTLLVLGETVGAIRFETRRDIRGTPEYELLTTVSGWQ
jgi:hypothetical protein